MAAGEAMQLTAAWVASATGGRVAAGDADRICESVAIDSRTMQAGALYVAIRGERFDGADFVEAAIAAGAAGAMVPRGWHAVEAGRRAGGTGPGGAAPAIIEVDDTITALQALGHAVRRASGSTVVAITGSAGKTTTKEITAEFLSARYRVMRNRGNFNNHIGLPLSLTELTARPEVAVVELGMNHAGEIRTLVGIAEPDIRVWTNVGEAHVGYFASVDAIADAKAEILESATSRSVLVANADDARIAARIGSFAGRVVTFGTGAGSDVRARQVVDRGIDGVGAHVTTPGGTVEIATPLVGRGNLSNLLAATAVAVELGVPLSDIAQRSARLRPASHRGEVVRLRDGIIVIDDSYNANPTATRGALDVLAATPAATRRVAVLGEMLELGDRAVALHEDVGRAAAAAADLLFAVGGHPARALADAAVAAGMPHASVTYVQTSDDAALHAAATVRAGDLVLVKGSRGIRTDRVVDRLKAERG